MRVNKTNGLPGWIVKAWLAVGLTACAGLFCYALPNSPLRGGTKVPPAVAAPSAAAIGGPAHLRRASPTPLRRRVLETRPIQTIQVGQRVLGTNPDPDETEDYEEPDPRTWRTVEVEMTKPSGKMLYATVLRSAEWLEENLDPETNTVELDMDELGASGPAKVRRIGPCPPIKSGPGHVVTATFKHQPDGPLLDVTVAGEIIGCTANHPFWSQDRHAFVEAGDLQEGELVLAGIGAFAPVTAIAPRPPAEWVFNLEVQGEHVYEVTERGILVHNKCTGLHHLWPWAWGNKIPRGSKLLTLLKGGVNGMHTKIHNALNAFMKGKGLPGLDGVLGTKWMNKVTFGEAVKLLKEFHKGFNGGKLYDKFLKELKIAVQKGYLDPKNPAWRKLP